jgi:pimeloyl-ACP methyl ester carboxylesterase
LRAAAELESEPYALVAEAQIALSRKPANQVAAAFACARRCKDVVRAQGALELIVVGHSLGGGLAAVVAANFGRAIGITYSAPGMRKSATRGAIFVSQNPAAAHRMTEPWGRLATHHLGRRRPQELVPG